MSGLHSRAIVIEDEKQIRSFVCAALEQAGCQAFEAETGAQGLVEAGTRKPDIVILLNLYGFTAIFPWFAEARGGITLTVHAVFGMTIMLMYRYSGILR